MKTKSIAALALLAGALLAANTANADCGAQHASADTKATKEVKATAASSTTAAAAKTADTAAPKNIVETAVAAGSFNTLVAAVKAAGLVETLSGKGPFTVFAPTDEAFAKLPKGTLEDLLKPENKAKLTSILTYHVVAGSVMAADVVKLESAKTANGQSVKIHVKDGKVMLGGSQVVKTDIGTSNGVIHVIDTVLLPADK
ncbi:MAG: fasciclin domain-containing protein [bacterium]